MPPMVPLKQMPVRGTLSCLSISMHDTGVMCAPYGTSQADASEGNFIMFVYFLA